MPVSLPVQPPESLLNAVETRLFALLHNTSVKVRIRNHADVQARPTAMATHISNAVKRLLGKLLPVGIGTKVGLFAPFSYAAERQEWASAGKRVQPSQLWESSDSDQHRGKDFLLWLLVSYHDLSTMLWGFSISTWQQLFSGETVEKERQDVDEIDGLATDVRPWGRDLSWKSQQVPFKNVRVVLKSSKGCYLVSGAKYYVPQWFQKQALFIFYFFSLSLSLQQGFKYTSSEQCREHSEDFPGFSRNPTDVPFKGPASKIIQQWDYSLTSCPSPRVLL